MIRSLALAATLALVACADRAPPANTPVAPVSGLAAAAFPEPRPERDGFVPRRRLEHTVTLGHDAYLPGERAAAPITSPAAVSIQNVITVNPPAAAWGGYGYGYGYGYGAQAPIRTTTPVNPATGTPPVGGNWPTIPDTGPRPMR